MNGFKNLTLISTAVATLFSANINAKDYDLVNGDEFYVSAGVTRMVYSENKTGKEETNWGPHILVGKYITKNISVELKYFQNSSDNGIGTFHGIEEGYIGHSLVNQINANLRFSRQANEMFAPYLIIGLTSNKMDYSYRDFNSSDVTFESKNDSGILGAVGGDVTFKHGIVNLELGLNEIDDKYQAMSVTLGYKVLF